MSSQHASIDTTDDAVPGVATLTALPRLSMMFTRSDLLKTSTHPRRRLR